MHSTRAHVLPLGALAGALLLVGLTAGFTRDERLRPSAELARLAVAGDDGQAREALADLRAGGPRSLDVFLAEHAAALAETPPAPDLRLALDRLCAQRDCWASRLYWFTDLEAAMNEARASGRPILSLRLLGRLDEELSCANSRFFRTALYADPRIATHLAERFVLHWESVRAAPRMTVDFGDGRSLVRTITGNSLHFVLDAEGRPWDALPGLYAPGTFLAALVRAETAMGQGRTEGDRLAALAAAMSVPGRRRDEGADEGGEALLPALRADLLAVSKMMVERPLLGSRLTVLAPGLDAAAATYVDAARLSGGSQALMRTQLPDLAEPDLVRRVASFERTLAKDTARNQLELRPQVLSLLAGAAGADLAELTRRVYRDVFLAPLDDPWCGLLPADAYSGIERDGVREAGR